MLHYSFYIISAVGAVLGWWFNRTKVFFTIILILIGYYMLSVLLPLGPMINPVGQVGFAAYCLLVPINLMLFSIWEERGVLTIWGVMKFFFILLQFVLVDFVIDSSFDILRRGEALELQEQIIEILHYRLFPRFFDSWTFIPQMGLYAFIISGLFFFIRAAFSGSAMDYGFIVVLFSVGFALHFAGEPASSAVFCLSAIVVMIVSVFQDSYNMAFNDKLTGIPGRQALDADLKKLGGKYSIAMLDIDHFKKFNDTYGHDVGDQVLKMVASHLNCVTGGGKAYRYGGEEFTIVYAGKNKKDVKESLEKVRASIENAGFRLRGKDRPKTDSEEVIKKRGQSKSNNIVAVTISIGATDRGRSDGDPRDVVKRADQALYKAKNKGRNVVVVI
jgi:diguanylate cyclase (GGDEF)-like protein